MLTHRTLFGEIHIISLEIQSKAVSLSDFSYHLQLLMLIASQIEEL